MGEGGSLMRLALVKVGLGLHSSHPCPLPPSPPPFPPPSSEGLVVVDECTGVGVIRRGPLLDFFLLFRGVELEEDRPVSF